MEGMCRVVTFLTVWGLRKRAIQIFFVGLGVVAFFGAFRVMSSDGFRFGAPDVVTSRSLPDSTLGFLEGEDVTLSYDVVAEVRSNGDVRFTETIVENFGSSSRGILRNRFLVEKVEGRLRGYPVKDLSVNVSSGAFEQTRVSVNNDELEIRVGEPDKRFTGVHVYELGYTVKAMVDEIDGVPYLNFDLIAGRPFPIKEFSGKVVAPVEIVEATCLLGFPGGESFCAGELKGNGYSSEYSVEKISVYEGDQLGVQLVFPEGSFPDLQPPILPAPPDLGVVVALTALVLLFGWGGMLLALRIRKNNLVPFQEALNATFDVGLPRRHSEKIAGKQFSGSRLTTGSEPTVEFVPPQKLRPAHMGVLLGGVTPPDLFVGTMLDLAARNWIGLVRAGSSNWTIEWKGRGDSPLLGFEHSLLEKVFEGQLSASTRTLAARSKNNTLRMASDIRNDVGKQLRSWGVLCGIRWDRKATTIFGFAMLLCWVSYMVLLAQGSVAGGNLFTFVLGAALLSMVFTTRSTFLGEALRWRVLGFKEFFEHSENYHARIAASSDILRQYMGYAVVFGEVDRWAKMFSVYTQMGDGLGGTQMVAFREGINRSVTSASRYSGNSGGFSSGSFSGGSVSGGSVSGGSSSGGGGRW